jgi:hypothetical protein
MNSHDYLVPIMAAAFMIINLLGAAFTISRVRLKRMRQMNEPSTGESRGFTTSVSFRSMVMEEKVLRYAIIAQWRSFGPVAIAAIIAILVTLGVAALGHW